LKRVEYFGKWFAFALEQTSIIRATKVARVPALKKEMKKQRRRS
tara:strand:- start:399 stop:530 length:132 start_codon:yes stop_codon:yes gene_type:complete